MEKLFNFYKNNKILYTILAQQAPNCYVRSVQRLLNQRKSKVHSQKRYLSHEKLKKIQQKIDEKN